MYPGRTLANTKLPPKTDSETIPTNSSVHKRLSYDCGHHRWIQRPGIILAVPLIALAFLAMVQKRRGPKMLVQQPGHTLPRLPEVCRMLITDTSVYSGNAASSVLAIEQLRTIEWFILTLLS